MSVAVVEQKDRAFVPDRVGRLPINRIRALVVDDAAEPRSPDLPEVPVPVVAEPKQESRQESRVRETKPKKPVVMAPAANRIKRPTRSWD